MSDSPKADTNLAEAFQRLDMIGLELNIITLNIMISQTTTPVFELLSVIPELQAENHQLHISCIFPRNNNLRIE